MFYIYVYTYVTYTYIVYCGYSQSSVSCFTNSTKLPEYYLDGASINIALYQSKQYNVQQQRGYKILQFTVDTNTWTPGLHLFEAKLDLRNCGSNFKQPYYSAVITKETNEGLYKYFFTSLHETCVFMNYIYYHGKMYISP